MKELERNSSETMLFVGDGLHVPVLRDRAQAVKELLLTHATDLRRGQSCLLGTLPTESG